MNIFIGYKVAQVKVIFQVTEQFARRLDTTRAMPKYLAYVEWFTKFEPQPQAGHRLYRIQRALQGQQRIASLIPLANIARSVHLMPDFGKKVPLHWTSNTVLDLCRRFYLNSFSDRHGFYTMR